MIGGIKHRLLEIEFCFKDNNHNDPFIHGDSHQQNPLFWYFHRQNGKDYKSGTFKGLDIVFGKNTSNSSFGGILIRSIQCLQVSKRNLDAKKIIEGPCNVVNYILNLCKYQTIEEMIKENLDSTISAEQLSIQKIYNKKLYLEQKQNFLETKEVFSGPRVGLSLGKTKDKGREHFIMKNYRFLIFADKIKKNINTIIINLHIQGFDIENISSKTHIKSHLISIGD